MSFTLSSQANWQGRPAPPNLKPQYWHEVIACLPITQLSFDFDFGLLGYVCDEGVRRNYGRIGAAQGSKSIREQLAKLPLHFENKRIADVGDVVCEDEDMETCQEHFANLTAQLTKQKICSVGLGGGHDIAYAHFKGLARGLEKTPAFKIGIINFDAHFDLRPHTQKSHSGTPFRQILTEFQTTFKEVNYLVIGIQQQSNPRHLFEFAAHNPNVDYILNDDCLGSDAYETILNKLSPFTANQDYLYISIDLDGFAAAYAPGVSAPSPFGLEPYLVLKILTFLLQTEKVIALDLAELNPRFDRDQTTAKLAARLIDYIVMQKPPSREK